MEITEAAYIDERLEHQISWYDGKSARCQQLYKRIKRTEIILATAIPVLAGLVDSCPIIAYLLGILGGTIAVLEGYLSIGKYHENWIDYRSICETLRHEKYMYLTKTGVYKTEDSFELLVERIESVISKENVNWANLNKPKETEDK